MNTLQRTSPIKIPPTRSHSSDLDHIHFSPPELRNRVEYVPVPIVPPEFQHRIEYLSKSMPNLKFKN